MRRMLGLVAAALTTSAGTKPRSRTATSFLIAILFHQRRARRGNLAILRRGDTGDANRADDFAPSHERDSAFDGRRAREFQDAHAHAARGHGVFKGLRRAAESH